MSRIVVSFAMAGMLFAFASCGSPVDAAKTNDGTVAVSLPTVRARAWNNSDVSSISDTYEILVYNSTQQFSSDVLTTSGTHNLSVPAGTYKVLVLAGVSTRLISMGALDNVVVVAENTTEVYVGIDTFNWTTTWPTEPVETATAYTVAVDLTLPLDVFHLISGYVRINGVSTETLYWSEIGNGVWHGSVTLTSPTMAGEVVLGIAGAPSPISFNLRDDDYSINATVSDVFQGNWTFPLASTFADGSPMALELEKSVTIASPVAATGIGVDIFWNPDT